MSSSSTQSFNIDILKDCDLNHFLDLHFEGLFKKSTFSKIYLRERFYFLLNNSETINVVVRDEYGKLIGLVYGGEEDYKNQMNKMIFKKTFLKFLLRPWIIFSNEIKYKIKNMLKRKRQQYTPLNNDLSVINKPTLRLTGIAVFQQYGRSGVGEILVNSFISRAVDSKYSSILLETPRYNEKAINFYTKLNWLKLDVSDSNFNKIYFYKNL
jgi:ribosomal protein S18 acetylase RimI-like enzyme